MDEKNTKDLHPEEQSHTDAADAQAKESAAAADLDETAKLILDARASAGMEEPQTPAEEFRDADYLDTFGEGDDLKRVFSDEPYEPAKEEASETPAAEPIVPPTSDGAEELSMRKGRPRRKKGYGLFGIPHILATVIWLAIVVAIGVSLGRVAWICAADVLAFGREDKKVQITVDDSDTLEDIAEKLKDAGLIRYPGLFTVYGIFSDAREDISSGTFTLNTIYDYHALVGQMNYYASNREIISVTIPEGYSCSQMFALLEEKGVCSVQKLENYASTGDLDEYWFLENVQRGDKYCLEGFLFPDTYDFYVNDSAEHVLEKLLDNFDNRFNDDMVAGIDALNEKLAQQLRAGGMDEDYIAAHKMGIREVVTVASLIEKETAFGEESFDISSVIYNRLTNPNEYPLLNIDAALLYALGHKEVLTKEDLQFDSPYNTYIHPGLVPGPITNPGLNSLNAALMPNDTEYHYYALDTNSETRQHHFTKSLAEHEAFLASLGD